MPRSIRGARPLTTRLSRRFHLQRLLRTRDWYKVLGVEKTASKKQIRDAYLAHVKEHHPDVSDGGQKADEHFLDVQEAYSVLSNESTRRTYDEKQQDDVTRTGGESRSQHFKTKPVKSESKFGMRRERFSQHFVIKDYKIGHPSWKQDFDRETQNKLKIADALVYATVFTIIVMLIAKTQQKASPEK